MMMNHGSKEFTELHNSQQLVNSRFYYLHQLVIEVKLKIICRGYIGI
jgi:hypothetical protein